LTDESTVCPRCASTIGAFTESEEGCKYCREENYHFSSVVRLGPYKEAWRSAALRLKKAHEETYAHLFAHWWAGKMSPKLPRDCQLVVPVPLHWSRRWERGFNQCHFLARELARQLKIPESRTLRRKRRSEDQKSLSGTERRKNLKQAFELHSSISLKNQKVILVDDVLTTGATADACSRVLVDAGATEVIVAIVAKG
jgi:ComF family protein